MSDDTLLESFIESISTLPQEVKRNLDLMKSLDRTCSSNMEELRMLQLEYVQTAEAKLDGLSVQPLRKDGSNNEIGVQIVGKPDPEAADEESGTTPEEPAKKKQKKSAAVPVVVPTTEEFSDYMVQSDASTKQMLERIRAMQQDVFQQADEKVAIAEQTHHLIHGVVERLDHDIAKIEKILQASGELVFDPLTGKAVEANTPPSTTTATASSHHHATTSTTTSTSTSSSGKPNDLAAIQVTADAVGSGDAAEWILAKILHRDMETGMYQLSDEDPESNKIFHLPEPQVVILNPHERYQKGDIVFAVYPDTTSFYQATVVGVPNARSRGGANSYVIVHFVDDADEFGITQDKPISSAHVMRPPYGATIQ